MQQNIMTKEEKGKGKSPNSKKTKTKEAEAKEVDAVETVPYEIRMKAVTVISKPMADEKKTQKFYKLVKRAAKDKICRRGVEEVCKGIRQGRKGICIIAGDISPIDVISHMAIYCEEQGVNYIYVPSKVDLGAAAKTKRPTSCVMITPPRETKEVKWDESTRQLFEDLNEVCLQQMSQVPMRGGKCEGNQMEDSAKWVTTTMTGEIPTRGYGLQFLEGEMMGLVGVWAGLKESLTVSTCCVSLRDTLACPALDEQLFGGLYAALAGVDKPSGAFLQPAPRRNLGKRREGSISATPEAQQQRQNQRPGTAECKTWKMKLKEDMATSREPLQTAEFVAKNTRGKQDCLLAVVPSTPPVIAITCTTELSLFSLDGTRLPVVTDPVASPVASPVAAAGSRRRWGHCGEGESKSTSPTQDSEDEDEDEDDDEGKSQVPAEAHERDIRCLAASPAGDMVATGSLDCTIRVRSVPGRDWIRRLRGHEAGLRCLVFHGTRLVSADSRGAIAAWEVFPDSRRLCNVQGHSDSVQVLTLTSGGERLASGALDGSVVVWSISADGILAPVAKYGGLCHPYRLVAIGRCLVFTSAVPRVLTGISHEVVDSNNELRGSSCDWSSSGSSCDGDGPRGGAAVPVSKGAHISVVDVEPTSATTKWEPAPRRVSTGLARLQHLVAGRCLGTVLLSQWELWQVESTSNADDWPSDSDDDGFYRDETFRDTYCSPRLCRIVGAERVTNFEDLHPPQSTSGPRREGRGGSGSLEALQADWMKVSLRWSAAEVVEGRLGNRGGRSHGGLDNDSDNSESSESSSSSSSSNGDSADSQDVELEANCTCAVFVGRTLFLGQDTGLIEAHRAKDGRRLYRLEMSGPIVHLVEAKGSLYAYDSYGKVGRWSWGNECCP